MCRNSNSNVWPPYWLFSHLVTEIKNRTTQDSFKGRIHLKGWSVSFMMTPNHIGYFTMSKDSLQAKRRVHSFRVDVLFSSVILLKKKILWSRRLWDIIGANHDNNKRYKEDFTNLCLTKDYPKSYSLFSIRTKRYLTRIWN